jgi:pimeloyl-ACP methyl ester carboxylesterase
MIRLPRLPMPGVAPIEPPRHEGVVEVGHHRVLGYAEFGDPDGRLVLWHHGTPGGRRQIPLAGRRAAERLGLRLVCVERPGVGDSTNHRYNSIREWAADAAKVVDHLGHDEFVAVGLSGGGPYALACGARLPDRVTAVGVLGGVVPSVGDDAVATGLVDLARRFNIVLRAGRLPAGLGLWGVIRAVVPLSHPALLAFASIMPPGDQAVLHDPEIEAMFIDDLERASRRQFRAVVNDGLLFGRHWGFELSDVQVPVRWWHGNADSIVSLGDAEDAVALLPDCELHIRPGESHLGGFAAADDVLRAIDTLWPA